MLTGFGYEITNVTLKDIKDVFKLLTANQPYVGLNSCYTYFLLAKDFSDTCFIAKKNSEVAAFSSAYTPPKRPDTLFNWETVVDVKHRGNGLQKALLLHQIKAANAKFLELTINPSNLVCRNNIVELADMLQAGFTQRVLFSEQDFGCTGHESEVLFRVGPIDACVVESLIEV